MAEEKEIPRWITYAASITTLAIPLLYIFGYAFDQGYLNAYDISSEFFPRSIQEYLTLAFMGVVHIAGITLKFFNDHILAFVFIAIILGTLSLIVVVIKEKKWGQLLKSKLKKISNEKHFDYFLIPAITFSVVLSITYIIVASLALIVLIPGAFYFTGANVAKKNIENSTPCICSDKTSMLGCITLFDNDEQIAIGRLVARSNTHIALYNESKVSIYAIEKQRVEIIPKINPSAPNVSDTSKTKSPKTKSP